MKVVGLVSGGKDSVYALYEMVVDYSFELVALAHISSMDCDSALDCSLNDLGFFGENFEVVLDWNCGEVDSWMYQSVGSEVVPFYALCMGKPIYVISTFKGHEGGCADQFLSEEDRGRLCHFGVNLFEDPVNGERKFDSDLVFLYKLLMHIKCLHPDVGGVVTGAIMSNYQRLRVEAICRALGLVNVSPLWQMDQSELLEKITSSLECVLIKASSYGLGPDDVGESMSSIKPKLMDLSSKYGINVCGEGGEYETLTLNSPIFDHYRLSICESKKKFHSSELLTTPTVYLQVKRLQIISKSSDEGGKGDFVKIHYKDIFSWLVRQKRVHIVHPNGRGLEGFNTNPRAFSKVENFFCDTPIFRKILVNHRKSIAFFYASNTCNVEVNGAHGRGIEWSTHLVMKSLVDTLKSNDLSIRDVGFVEVTVGGDVTQFKKINDIYCEFLYPIWNPPSRVTIFQNKTKLGVGIRIWGWKGSEDGRSVYHVESLSKLLPACIGPYSQAHSLAFSELEYFCGMIALDPIRMEILPRSGALCEVDELVFQLQIVLKHTVSLLRIRGHTEERYVASILDVVIYTVVDISVVKGAFGALDFDGYNMLGFLEGARILRVGELPKSALVEISVVATKYGDFDWNETCYKKLNIWRFPNLDSGGWARVEYGKVWASDVVTYVRQRLARSKICSHFFVQVAMCTNDDDECATGLLNLVSRDILRDLSVSQEEVLSAHLYCRGGKDVAKNVGYDFEVVIESVGVEQMAIVGEDGVVNLASAILCFKVIVSEVLEDEELE